jgi:hypothetical protein
LRIVAQYPRDYLGVGRILFVSLSNYIQFP